MKLTKCSDGRVISSTKGLRRGEISASPVDRVLAKVEIITETGCWIFMGAINDAGYGLVGLGGRGSGNDRAHRITYRHFVGEIPSGMFVCHRCDVPACCNPAHLFIGTPAENHKDMIEKGRGSKPPRNSHDVGSNRYNAKLNDEIVKEARSRKSSGESGYSIWKWLKDEFGITAQAPVYRMLAGKTWRHV